ncbi:MULTISPECIES: Imm30 family immunity protein [Bacillus cereus group]|uniref:Imm30 family immunity protein n=1 Tax=Bacillus cereus group TaxID=86661 RepID=UPI0022E1B1D7|nr:Imm30 family immunity protein [Bacillus cereus group sp. TH254-2LC]MDA1533798.1 Imm30 family immunity protein [Bacillus cereus group sp. TH254-2LC]
MDIKSHLKRLYDNRLLENENENEIRDFNESLMEVIEYNDVSVITDLCLVLDDETEQFEVMFGLIHGIESLYKNNIEEGLVCIAKAVPKMINSAKEWVEILHYRILNHPQVRLAYGKVLSEFDPSITISIKELLIDIKNEDPDMFSESVNEVIKSI